MGSLSDLLQQSAANAWLFVPTAILLGALHGLEPGHSKTMMAAFIIAVRGTVRQAVLLGLAATLSHTVVVWVVVLGGLWFFADLNVEETEPYFQLVSGLLIIALAIWMLLRTRREQRAMAQEHSHEHHHHNSHDHDHDHHHDHHHHHDHAPHRFLRASTGLNPAEKHDLEVLSGDFADAHEMEHAADIRRRFSNQSVTTGQIILFGLTGGLVPCPGAITVLLLCLQFQRLTLGAVLVLCFSIGLALTMVASGVIAALSLKHMSKRWSGFGDIVRKAPYVSSAVILLLGLYVAIHGWSTLPQG
ncbi:MAG: nickel/cobalt efflux transporter RcnA [Pseudomonadales bacterium]|jgi:nickel/cobalt exporter|nr:nickel/cobalt efflux transporter RcnA [Pseudomonadales bacterium]